LDKNYIGVFDSGYGGLTVMKQIVEKLPEYDYIYIGDNARAPYGSRSYETVYRYTLQAVKWLFNMQCGLVILACNTASAKALRTIQQKDLPSLAPDRRVLGVIRPVTETLGNISRSKHVGVFATSGTVKSESYLIETAKFFPDVKVVQEACPLWVPLIENNDFDNDGAAFFIRRHVNSLFYKDPLIDAVVLGCTHYPIIINQIKKYLPQGTLLIDQGAIVADSLSDYLVRHPEITSGLSVNGTRNFFTSDSTSDFDRLASLFYGQNTESIHIDFE
jgi:glutamate racemase